jgi:hypothetical protein
MDSDYGYLPTMAFKLAANASSLAEDVAMSESSAESDDIDDDGTVMNHRRAIGESVTTNHQRAIDVGTLSEELLDRALDFGGDSENSGIWKEQVERMVAIAMWCVQPEAARRPTMASVVQMLEGGFPVAPPPLLGANVFFDGSEPHCATSKASSSLSPSTVLTTACTSTTTATTTTAASDPPSPFLSDAKS